MIFENEVLDPHKKNEAPIITVPKSGLILEPGKLYLGTTFEIIGSNVYVTSLLGRSSIGRLGIYVQISADLGQLGAIHRWTLEITVVQPIKIYPYVKIGQVTFWRPFGEICLYDGEYDQYSTPIGNRTILI